MQKLFVFCFENPLKTWWKGRKYFVKPKAHFSWFNDIYTNCPFVTIDFVGKLLTIWCRDIGWKDKYGSPRHEFSPYIWVCFFKKFGFSISWHITYKDENSGNGFNSYIGNGDLYYWEYLLDYLYYSKNLKVCSVWKDSKNMAIPTQSFSLNKRGKCYLVDHKFKGE